MHTSDALPLQHDSDVQGRCSRCGATSPPDAVSCPSCGAELGSETVIDDPRRSDEASQGDTAPNGTSLASGPASALPSFADTDDEIEPMTSIAPRGRGAPASAPSAGSSSDPPTRFLRGIEQHIELPAGSIVDDYEVDAKLGAGAMGVVYSARHLKLGRRVAIKVIAPQMCADPQALARFEREARALASLRHPNIVDVYSFGALPDGRTYFAMELIPGTTLYERLQRGRVPLDEALDVVDQMARALEAAHAAGIVHRDLKPENTFLQRLQDGQLRVVLLDFGLSLVPLADGAERTASGAVIGTALYLSPEQARGPNVDGRTDIYALGVVAYELVLGQHPFPHARTAMAALAAHLTEDPPQPRTIWPAIPAALDLLLYSMIAKDAAHRPTLPKIRSVIESVRSAATASSRHSAVTRATTTPSVPLLIDRRMIVVAVVVMVVGIVIGAAFRGSRSEAGRSAKAAVPHVVDPDGAPAPMPLVGSDVRVVDVATSTPPPIVDGAVRPALGAESVPNSESPVDAEPARTTPTRPTPPTRGFLKILPPQGAEVLVDGKLVGSLGKLPLAPGKHKVRFSVGWNKDSFLVTIEAGETVTLDKRDLYQSHPSTR